MIQKDDIDTFQKMLLFKDEGKEIEMNREESAKYLKIAADEGDIDSKLGVIFGWYILVINLTCGGLNG